MTDIKLSDLENRIMIFLHLANDHNFFPEAKIISRVMGVAETEVKAAMDHLKKINYVKRHINDASPDKDGYRAYLPDTGQEQPLLDETISAGGGGSAKEGQGNPSSDTKE